MHLFKPALRYLFIGSLLALCGPLCGTLCGKTVNAQVPIPDYGFVTVADESGAPVTGAAVTVYNASGEEVFHRITNAAGGVRITRHEREAMIKEQKLSNSNRGNCIVRIVNPGYLTYEVALEGDLGERLVLREGGSSPRSLLQVTLSRRRRSKVSEMRKRSLPDRAHYRPP
jgi:hypothetical protein